VYDLAVKNGWIVDGIGMPRVFGDVAVQGGRIAEIGRVREPARRTIDADGRVVSPGFIDMHTHYDAQVTWDPLLTSSCWHGVTSVVFGNCGFAVAPCKPEDREYIMQMLTRVEGMDLGVLRAGIDWRWQTYPEFLAALEGRLGLNAGALIGHSAVRYYVMGPDSYERAATADEVAQMQAIVREGLLAGGLGFSTSRQPFQVAMNGRPVPSLLAGDAELLALVGVLGELNVGSVEIVPDVRGGMPEEQRRLIVRMAKESGRPLNWNTVMEMSMNPGAWRGLLDFTRAAVEEERAPVWALNTCARRDHRFRLGTRGDRPFRSFAVWQAALEGEPEERIPRLRDPETRERLRADMADHLPDAYARYDRITVDDPVRPENRALIGKSVAQLGAERGRDPLDVFLDLALTEDLETGFKVIGVNNGDDEAVREIVTHPYAIAGLSDAGAHMDLLCGYGVPGEVLGKWVRDKGALTLEEGVRRLTSMPAAIAGIPNRGILREGYAADLTIFDPATIRPREPETARDLPGGAARLIQRADGIAYTIVNGEVFMEDGRHSGALPGQVLRNRLAARPE
jgi:N-acyl-D-aspartate/D-glutamate deacylase